MASAIPTLPPLRFRRRALEKVWGGRRLERVPGIALPAERPIGETWELSDRDDEPSIVAEGPYEGAHLGELVRERRAELLGRARATPAGRFPLLVKYLDASQPLSVQVHPLRSDATRGEEAKTEAWLFLDAEPGSRIWLGLAPGADRAAFTAAAGTRAIVSLVQEWPARAGECVFVRGGTVHAIGAGIALLEVQENSDTTHRLYDWDRVGLDGEPRPIHVESALRSIEWDERAEGPRAPVWRDVAGGRRALLIDCPLFTLERAEVASDAASLSDDTLGFAVAWTVLSGRGRLTCAAGAFQLTPGDVWLVPACVGAHRIETTGGPLSAVRIGTRP